jgi:hypothetical protein
MDKARIKQLAEYVKQVAVVSKAELEMETANSAILAMCPRSVMQDEALARRAVAIIEKEYQVRIQEEIRDILLSLLLEK